MSYLDIKHILLDIGHHMSYRFRETDTGRSTNTKLTALTIQFPYAINALPKVLSTKWDDSDFKPYRDAFPDTARASPEAFQEHVEDLTRGDVKIAYLKNLQGYLWQEGYESGAYATPLYDDVLPALERWVQSGKKVSIYSSGSVFAQKLLFRHVSTQSGDVIDRQDFVSQWFDTTNAGSKHDPESYSTIVKAVGEDGGHVLFLSDNVKEIEAARESGLTALLVYRPGNAAVSKDEEVRLGQITNFEQLDI